MEPSCWWGPQFCIPRICNAKYKILIREIKLMINILSFIKINKHSISLVNKHSISLVNKIKLEEIEWLLIRFLLKLTRFSRLIRITYISILSSGSYDKTKTIQDACTNISSRSKINDNSLIIPFALIP